MPPVYQVEITCPHLNNALAQMVFTDHAGSNSLNTPKLAMALMAYARTLLDPTFIPLPQNGQLDEVAIQQALPAEMRARMRLVFMPSVEFAERYPERARLHVRYQPLDAATVAARA